MGRLYPPHIEGKLPAQSGNTLQFPFQMNRAVSNADIQGIKLLIKTISTGVTIDDYDAPTPTENNIAVFKNIDPLTPGQHYKAQLAFIGKDGLGYYSSVGVFKYTNTISTDPSDSNCIYIDNMTNTHKSQYVGVYRHEGDITEKAYSYCFNIYHSDDTIALTSGTQIHNNTNDTSSTESSDIWNISQSLEEGTYTVEYVVTTMNNLVCRSEKYRIEVSTPLSDDRINSLHMSLKMENDYDNGCIRLTFEPRENTKVFCNGEYIIARASSKDNFKLWQDIHYFAIEDTAAMPYLLFTDFTTEQGVTYCYGLYKRGINGDSDKVWFITNQNGIWEDYITADFEDIFLYDGCRQFKVRYNPKISSFKATILESKTDTIGGPYPFIFRNGDVRYHEMSISGLVSQVGDNEEMFMRKRDLGYATTPATGNGSAAAAEYQIYADMNLSTANFAAERTFKNFALSWLTNGQPKLLRTPAEGNYLVRLLNTSMSPLDNLSRMLHTFTSTVYEVAEYNIENLVKFGMLENCLNNIEKYMTYSTGLVSGATYVELPIDKQHDITYEITYVDRTKEHIIVKQNSQHPYVLNNFDLAVSTISPTPAISGIMDTPMDISFSPNKASISTRSIEFKGVGQDKDILLSIETIEYNGERFDVKEWSLTRLTNTFANQRAYWIDGDYQTVKSHNSENNTFIYEPITQGILYAFDNGWVKKVNGISQKFSQLHNYIQIKPHKGPQQTIIVPNNTSITEGLEAFSGIEIDYLYVGNAITVSGTYKDPTRVKPISNG